MNLRVVVTAAVAAAAVSGCTAAPAGSHVTAASTGHATAAQPSVSPRPLVFASSVGAGAIDVPVTGEYEYQVVVSCLTPAPFSTTHQTPGFGFFQTNAFLQRGRTHMPYTSLKSPAGIIWLFAGRWIGVPGYDGPFDPVLQSLPPYLIDHPCPWSLTMRLVRADAPLH